MRNDQVGVLVMEEVWETRARFGNAHLKLKGLSIKACLKYRQAMKTSKPPIT